MDFTTKQGVGITAVALTLIVSTMAVLTSKIREAEPNFCSSVYRIEQALDLRVFLGDIQDTQQIKIKNNLHIKEVQPLLSSENDELFLPQSTSNFAQYVMQIEPIASQVNGVSQSQGDRYQHPFLVTVNKYDGHLVDLQSTTENESILKEYMAVFDFFQLATQQGKYHYLNSNGRYTAEIAYPKNTPQQLLKYNLGYTQTEHNISMQNNEQIITLSDSECFYQHSTAKESYTINMSPKAYMQGEGLVTINAQSTNQWPSSESFEKLTANITQWPNYKPIKPISQTLAFSEIKNMLTALQAKISNKNQVISIIKQDAASWPLLGNYLIQNKVPDALTDKVIWGLQRANTQASISALVSIITNPVKLEVKQNALQALARTSARINFSDLTKLQQLALESTQKIELVDNEVLLIKVLGMMVNRRSLMPSDNMEQLKQFLVMQLEHANGNGKIPYVQAISHFLTEIDDKGIALLLAQFESNLGPLRLAATQSLKKVAYDDSFTKPILKQLKKEPQADIRTALIQLLEHATSQHLAVKTHLISILNNSVNSHERAQVLHTLHGVDYSFSLHDIAMLKRALTRENVPTNQRLLATILLKQNDNET